MIFFEPSIRGISRASFENAIGMSAGVRNFRHHFLDSSRAIMAMLKFEYEFLPAVAQFAAAREQEGRIRAALGLSRGPLPKVTAEWLRKYHSYLSAKLIFPFRAKYAEELSAIREPIVFSVEVFALVHPSEMPKIESTALLCRIMRDIQEEEIPLVDLEVEEDHPNFRLLEDYWYWIWNWRFDPRI
jgi:hypothetical protein